MHFSRRTKALAATVALILLVAACSSGVEPILVEGGARGAGGALVSVPVEPSSRVRSGAFDLEVDVREAESVASSAAFPPEPTDDRPLVIYDTDMGPDVDDVLALSMLHTYERQGLIELAAVTVSRDSIPGARYVDAVNTFFGRPDVPIGVFRGDTVKAFDDNELYVATAGSWPQDVADQPVPDGFRVQRQVLAEAEAQGREVVVIQTGFAGNLAALLGSRPDQISDRPGVDLIRDNVSLLSVMAGAPDIGIIEFNIENDIPSAQTLFTQWPGRLVLSPFELGNSIHYPYSSITRDYNWTDRHPVREAYEFEDLSWHRDAPPYYDMKSWDLTSVIYAVEPDAAYFLTSSPGTVTVDDNGRTTFRAGSGRHVVLDRAGQYTDDQRRRIIDRMIELSSAQPDG